MRLYRRTERDETGAERTFSKWWVQYYVGGKLFRRALKTSDKRAAELLAGDLVRREELKAAGIIDPHEEHKTRAIGDHLSDFESAMRARDVVSKYVKDRMGCLAAFVEASGTKRMGDLAIGAANDWVNALVETGLSARSVNGRIAALRQFGRWLVRTRRLPHDPFDTLKPRNEAVDRRHVRRALTPDEVTRLLDAARRRPLECESKRRKYTPVSEKDRARLVALGDARAMTYLLAVTTGLRRSEVARLRLCDVDLDKGRARVPAASAKSKVDQYVEIHPHVVAALRAAWPKDALPTATVIPAGSFPIVATFHADLAYAKIARRDGQDRVVDFHALRHTFISNLAASGVHPRIAQALARHSSIELTMNYYTDLSLLDLRGAVARLPMPGTLPATTGQAAAG